MNNKHPYNNQNFWQKKIKNISNKQMIFYKNLKKLLKHLLIKIKNRFLLERSVLEGIKISCKKKINKKKITKKKKNL